MEPGVEHGGSITITALGQGNVQPEYLIDATLTLDTAVIFQGVTTPLGPTTTTLGVPEPSTWAMMLAGFASLGFAGFLARRPAVLASSRCRAAAS